jgi:hypothetical protein
VTGVGFLGVRCVFFSPTFLPGYTDSSIVHSAYPDVVSLPLLRRNAVPLLWLSHLRRHGFPLNSFSLRPPLDRLSLSLDYLPTDL